ncbi:MAG TPA: DNA translocase FtsK, partial [Candidatus Binataceae bacterium]|nr:DNA translocase FtsK [Candidatus Binataceae bacterium]
MSRKSEAIPRKEKAAVELAPAPPPIEDVPPASPRDYRIAREIGALAMLAIAGFCAASLVSVDLGRTPNLGGPAGAAIAAALGGLIGRESYVLLVLFATLALRVWAGAPSRLILREISGGALLVVALATADAILSFAGPMQGGALGGAIAGSLMASLNIAGGAIAVGLSLVCAIALMLKRAPTELIAAGARRAWPFSRRLAAESGAEERGFTIALNPADEISVPASDGKHTLKVKLLDFREAMSRPRRESASASKPRQKGSYKLPPQSILDLPPAQHTQVDEEQLERSARILEQKLADFGVEGRVVEVQPGPVVTMYKFEPGSGIKVSQIVNLSDDLSMALRAAAVRIQAPVPGEAVVGIEVPNRKRERIYLREILEAEAFVAAQSHLTIALGKDIAGRPEAADLARMPHLLIAGATGAGKSVSIHTMIASILFNATADDVRLILVDPKMLELSVYENIPHLLVPVVVDPQKAAASLLWATQEMERRYLMMREFGVRNIDSYNKALAEGGTANAIKPPVQPPSPAEGPTPEPIEHRRLPKIVIVIDELADLLLSEGKTVERDITRLAQKARASGIHLILATQRPSVDVITGLIKANLPARISFQVTSRVDSRTILDSIGAERLLGAGDMLYMPPGSAKLRRLHGPFVSENEIRKLADFLREQGAPEYRMEILETKAPGEGENGDGAGGEQDEMYDEAVR